jgi:ankyrin repeat protein
MDMNLIQYSSLQGYDRYIDHALSTTQNPAMIVNESTVPGMTGLHFAALNGHSKTAEILIKYGADISQKNRLQQTPLHLSVTRPANATQAIIERKIQLFHFLKIKVPHLLSAPDISGNTVAHLVSRNGYIEIVHSFIRENPDLLKQLDKFGHSALQMAILNRQFEIAKSLTVIPELLSLCDGDGKRALHYAAQYADPLLLQLCLDVSQVDLPDRYSKSALLYATVAGNLPNTMLLVEKGANVNAKDIYGWNVIHHAVASRNLELVNWLLSNTSANINEQDQLGRSPLMKLLADSVNWNNETEALIDLLIIHGAELSIKDQRGNGLSDYIDQLTAKGISVNKNMIHMMTRDGPKMSL